MEQGLESDTLALGLACRRRAASLGKRIHLIQPRFSHL